MRRQFVLAAGLLTVCSCAWIPSYSAEILALPNVSAVVTLRVAYLHNPRFAPLTEPQINDVLAHATTAVKQHFALDVRFSPVQRLALATAFAGIPVDSRAKAEKERLDPTPDALRQAGLAYRTLADIKRDGDLPAQARFALPHLLQAPDDDTPLALARALVATQHSRLLAWQRVLASDGKPLLGDDRFNEYTYWLALGNAGLPFEVVLTNQPIASAEWDGNSVHSALRGGVTNGITHQSRSARNQLYSVVSSFAFVDGSEPTRQLRLGEQPSLADANRYLGLMLAHELGHQLLHLGHPFTNPHCVMTPPVLLAFRQWADGLAAGQCALGSSTNNTPGVIKFALPQDVFK